MIAASPGRDESGAVFAALPLFHTNALVVTLLAPLLRGRPSSGRGRWATATRRCSAGSGRSSSATASRPCPRVPTVYAALAEVPVDADIGSLRMPIVGAAPLPPAVAEAFRARTGVELCEGYGLTEATCASACTVPGARAAGDGRPAPALPGHAGRADRRRRPARGSCCPTARSACWSSGARPCSPATSCRGPDGPRPAAAAARSATAGWTPATSARSTPTATSASPAAPRTSSSAAATTSTRRSIEDALLAHPAVDAPPRPSGGRTRTPARSRSPTSRSPPAPPSTRTSCGRGRPARVPEPAAAPKRVEVVDAIPLTAVGKPFKPELRRRAAEAAARDALAGLATGVSARLADGQVVVTVRGGDRAVGEALGPFAFAWET